MNKMNIKVDGNKLIECANALTTICDTLDEAYTNALKAADNASSAIEGSSFQTDAMTKINANNEKFSAAIAQLKDYAAKLAKVGETYNAELKKIQNAINQ